MEVVVIFFYEEYVFGYKFVFLIYNVFCSFVIFDLKSVLFIIIGVFYSFVFD